MSAIKNAALSREAFFLNLMSVYMVSEQTTYRLPVEKLHSLQSEILKCRLATI
jgi:hypothetical protein